MYKEKKMYNNNWGSFDNLGKTLENMVNSAVRMGDFSHLTQNINNTIKHAMDDVGSKPYDFKLSNDEAYNDANASTGSYSYRKKNNTTVKTTVKKEKKPRGLYKSKTNRVLIAAFCILFGVSGLISNVALFSLTSQYIVTTIIFVALLCYGVFRLKLSKKFDVYLKAIGTNTYMDIEHIALYANEPKKKTVNTIKKLIRKQWFKCGHLDIQETCLMTTEADYNQYLEALKHAQKTKAKNQAAKEEFDKKAEGMSSELRALLEKGSEYVATIRHINDEVPGEVISNKMYKLEDLVKKIFAQVEAHPETADNLERMMDYYLPMTIKLLSAYEELDKQPLQGENIINSKKEIENTIDSLNIAFEKIFDDMFEDTSFNVASDISVLHTVLAQDGLTDDKFTMNANSSKK